MQILNMEIHDLSILILHECIDSFHNRLCRHHTVFAVQSVIFQILNRYCLVEESGLIELLFSQSKNVGKESC